MTRHDIEDIIPPSILSMAGVKINQFRFWLERNEVIRCVDHDPSTPLGIVKFFSFGEKCGEFLGLWFGLGREKPIVVYFSGVEYCGFVRPIELDVNVFVKNYRKLTQSSEIRKLNTTTSWMDTYPLLIPNESGSNLTSEFLKSPMFVRFGNDNGWYGDYLDRHRNILRFMNRPGWTHDLLTSFSNEKDVYDYNRWMDFSKVLLTKGTEGNALCALENAFITYRLYAPEAKGSGYPEDYIIIRNFYKNKLQPFISEFPEWIQRIVALKTINLDRLAIELLAELKKKDKEQYTKLSKLMTP